MHERKKDIILLTEHFMTHYNHKLGKRFKKISPETKNSLLEYHWPGNVRELRNMVERIILLEDGDTLLPEHLTSIPTLEEEQCDGVGSGISSGSLDYEETTKALIEEALKRAGGNVVEAAQLLNIPVYKLRYRIKKFGLRF